MTSSEPAFPPVRYIIDWEYSSDEEDDEDPPGTITVFNIWRQEGGCGGSDGESILSFTLPHCWDEEVVKQVNVKPGQFLLVTWSSNIESSCCSGYNWASLEVLDEEPDLGDKEKYPPKNQYNNFEYKVKSHETLKSEILGY